MTGSPYLKMIQPSLIAVICCGTCQLGNVGIKATLELNAMKSVIGTKSCHSLRIRFYYVEFLIFVCFLRIHHSYLYAPYVWSLQRVCWEQHRMPSESLEKTLFFKNNSPL